MTRETGVRNRIAEAWLEFENEAIRPAAAAGDEESVTLRLAFYMGALHISRMYLEAIGSREPGQFHRLVDDLTKELDKFLEAAVDALDGLYGRRPQ